MEYFCSRPTQSYIDCSIAIVWLVSNVFSKLFHRRTKSQIVNICFFSPQCLFSNETSNRQPSGVHCQCPSAHTNCKALVGGWWMRLRPSVSVSLQSVQFVQQHVVAEMCMEARLAAEHWWARCRAPLPPAVSQLGTSWYQDNPSLKGELQPVSSPLSWRRKGVRSRHMERS